MQFHAASAQPLSSDKDRFLGAGTSSPPWRNFYQYWNQVTPGNDGKWGSVSYTQGQYNWTNLDAIYNYAVYLGLIYKHHNLVWGNQQPGWISGLDTASQRAAVEDWIKRVGQRYPKMDFVDVVNEPIHAPPPYAAALGGSGSTGWDWVITSFQLARTYCAPGVKLLLNEYNLLGSASTTATYLTIINLLKNRGLIDGIGVQGHYFEFRSHIGTGGYVYSLTDIRNNLSQLTATGLPVYITEFDVDEPVDSNQVAEYKTYFPILWSNPGVKGITFWGYIQNDVWSSYPNTYLLYSDGRERPAMQWLRTFLQIPLPPTLLSPATGAIVQRNVQLVWHATALSKSYHLQVSDNRTFGTATLDTTVADTTLQVKPLLPNTAYYWRVSAVNDIGASDYSAQAGFTTSDLVSGIKTPDALPDRFALFQNFPNPFNPTTAISYHIPAGQAGLSAVSSVKLTVFDLLGREVATLMDGLQPAGEYSVQWNASSVPSGVYFYRLQVHPFSGDQAGSFVETKKMVVSK
ncbi:MAG TPA: endo-1,4-beta-xylanase [Bacteroidota bacterium]|nr:endo-1,4-beta-xylanase [Bacteroidota bacterium]